MDNGKKRWWEYNPGAAIDEPGSSVRYKTGTWRSTTPIILKEKCTGCRKCWLFCPEGCIRTKNGKEVKKAKEAIKIDYDYCKGCGICANECPFEAISFDENRLSGKLSQN